MNESRRAALADAAVALLGAAGVHGVTHRAVERAAGLPTGTASNYFRSREALLVAAADRVVDLHHRDMDLAAAAESPDPAATTAERVVDLISGSLHEAATTHRARYLAIFELRLEALRTPALARALARLTSSSEAFTGRHHALLGLDVPPERVPGMVRLYGGALFTLVSAPPGEVTPADTLAAAEGIARAAGLVPPPP